MKSDADHELDCLAALAESSEEELWDVDEVEKEAAALVARNRTKKSAQDTKDAKAAADKRRKVLIRAENDDATVTLRPPRSIEHLKDANFNFHAGQQAVPRKA